MQSSVRWVGEQAQWRSRLAEDKYGRSLTTERTRKAARGAAALSRRTGACRLAVGPRRTLTRHAAVEGSSASLPHLTVRPKSASAQEAFPRTGRRPKCLQGRPTEVFDAGSDATVGTLLMSWADFPRGANHGGEKSQLTVGFLVPATSVAFTSYGQVASGLATGLRSVGVSSRLIAVGPSAPAWLPARDPFASSVRVRAHGQFHGSPLLLNLRELRSATRDIDVLHLIGYREPAIVASGILATAPIVLEPSGTLARRDRSILLKRCFDISVGRHLLACADKVVATAQLEAEDFRVLGVPQGRVVVRGLGVDVPDRTTITPGRARARLDVPLTAELVVSIGRIARKKSLQRLVPTIAERPNSYLVIAGPDDKDGALDRLQRSISDHAIGARVRIIRGGVWADEKWELIRDSDVFCLPSDHENFGIAPAEAAAFGTPTIVTTACGVGEILRDFPGHMVVDPREAKIRSAINRLLDDREVAATRAALNTLGLRQRLSWTQLAREQAAIYTSVLSRTGR